ncbi:hypothetical protein SNEBB_010998 [Seison nebaliae]|nr:hypothetical protein SNEBB_010998 [Seison nebaliae]
MDVNIFVFFFISICLRVDSIKLKRKEKNETSDKVQPHLLPFPHTLFHNPYVEMNDLVASYNPTDNSYSYKWRNSMSNERVMLKPMLLHSLLKLQSSVKLFNFGKVFLSEYRLDTTDKNVAYEKIPTTFKPLHMFVISMWREKMSHRLAFIYSLAIRLTNAIGRMHMLGFLHCNIRMHYVHVELAGNTVKVEKLILANLFSAHLFDGSGRYHRPNCHRQTDYCSASKIIIGLMKHLFADARLMLEIFEEEYEKDYSFDVLKQTKGFHVNEEEIFEYMSERNQYLLTRQLTANRTLSNRNKMLLEYIHILSSSCSDYPLI